MLGAGLAGCCLARALAEAEDGALDRLVLVEEGEFPASRASGNPVGILHPLLSRDFNRSSQLALAGLRATRRWLEALDAERLGWAGWPGSMECVPDEATARRVAAVQAPHGVDLAVSTPEQTAGRLADPQALWWGVASSWGGWVEPAQFAVACFQDAKERLGDRFQCAVGRSEWSLQAGECRAEWLVRLQAIPGIQMVDCTGGAEIQRALGSAVAEGLHPVAGQLSWLEGLQRGQMTALPSEIVCGSGYAAWLPDSGRLVFGASFEPQPGPGPHWLRQADAQENIDRLGGLLPRLARELGAEMSRRLQGRRSIRLTTPDRLPLAGAVPALEGHRPRQSRQPAVIARIPRWWMLLGLGSRGLSLAPLAAEGLAALLLDRPAPGEEFTWLDPGRFVERRSRRAH